MNSEFILVVMTAPTIEVANRISDALLQAKRVACVNILPALQSHYIWHGQVNHEQEVLLMAKTRRELFGEEFIQLVKRHHPYEVPEIIALPIMDGSSDYLDWIDAVTRE